MSKRSPDHSMLVDESLCERFKASWQAGTPERLSECLLGADTSGFLPTLAELVHIQLEFAWKDHAADGARPISVEALLEEFSVLGDEDVLLGLLRQEYYCRAQAGDAPSAEDYRDSFPDLDLDHLATPPDETVGPRATDDTATRATPDDSATLPIPGTPPPSPVIEDVTLNTPLTAGSIGDDQALASSLDIPELSLYDENTISGDEILDASIIEDDGTDTINTESPGSQFVFEPGRQVPGYELLCELGRGGMGVVYRALDTRLKRVVALKMILSGAHAGERDLKRFQQEAEAVAQLQHPNIVQIYEVGEHEGQPFLSLEIVEGGALNEKIFGEPQPPTEAAALVEQLARAVHFAHQRNIVHRDLKPANVLLTAEGEPKITDFGLAKRLGDDVSQTASGSLMGTPSYMAPEQAGKTQAAIGPQTDVYALGAILYCLLTGRPPFQSSSVMDTVMQVLEQEPVRPRQLVTGLDRDLETIALKCLQKSPERRYESAEELAEELRRYQAGEPIEARSVGEVEQVWRWCRRKPLLATLWGSLATLIVFVTINGYYQAQEQARLAEQAEQDKQGAKIEAQIAALASQRALKQKEIADKNFQMATDAVDGLTQISQDELFNLPQMEPVRRALLEKARAFYETFAEQTTDDPKLLAKLGSAHGRLGGILRDLGDPSGAKVEFEKRLEIFSRLVKEDPDRASYAYSLGVTFHDLGRVHSDLGKPIEALEAYTNAVAIRKQLAKDHPSKLGYTSDLAYSYNNFGLVLRALGRPSESSETLNKAIVIRKQLVKDHPGVRSYVQGLAQSYHNLGWGFQGANNHKSAVSSYTKAISLYEPLVKEYPKSPGYASMLSRSYNNLGNAFRKLNRLSESLDTHNKALNIRASLAKDHPDVPLYTSSLAMSHNNLGETLARLGKFDESIVARKKSIAIREQLAKEQSDVPDYVAGLGSAYSSLGDTFRDIGKNAEAIEPYKKAIAIREQLVKDHPDVPVYASNLASSYHNLGNGFSQCSHPDEASKAFNKSIVIGQLLVKKHPEVATYASQLGWSYYRLGNELSGLDKPKESIVAYLKAIVIREQLVKKYPDVPLYAWKLAETFTNLGSRLRDLAKHKDSIEAFSKSIAIYEQLVKDQPEYPGYASNLAYGIGVRAAVVAESGDHASAVETAEKLALLKVEGNRPTGRALNLYNAACVLSLASGAVTNDGDLEKAKRTQLTEQYATRAMELLREARQAGWFQTARAVAHLKNTDRDLDPLRERDDFKAFLRELEAKPAKPKKATSSVLKWTHLAV